MDKVFYAGNTIFEAFVQDLLIMPINLILALYLVYPRYLFNMDRPYMFSRDVKTLKIDGYLTLVLWTHGNLTAFQRLVKYGEPLLARKAHASMETYSYKSRCFLVPFHCLSPMYRRDYHRAIQSQSYPSHCRELGNHGG